MPEQTEILIENGIKTGLYTSPHIFKYNERIKINGLPITDKELYMYTKEIIEISEKNDIDLTEFEILTAVMFKYFLDNEVEVVLLETGLGGRYDATNVIKNPLCTIITHIDLDHTERLGNTIEKISYEKSGIMKKNTPCIVAEKTDVLKECAKETGAKLITVKKEKNTNHLSLKGEFQKENLSLAKKCIKEIFPEITEKTIEEGLKKVKHPCRFQYIKEKNLIIDGAHNPNGIEVLKESIEKNFPKSKKRYIFGCLKNKDYKKMTRTLFEKEDEIYFYHFSHKDSLEFKDFQKIYPNSKILKEKNCLKKDKLNVICGSFYMLSELLKFLGIEI